MSKTLLVNPTERTDISRVLEMRAPPMGLMYLGAMMEKERLPVEILDANLYDMTMMETSREIVKRNPSILGLTATTATVKNAMRIANGVRRLNPNVVIILGGVHATFLPARTLLEGSAVDALVVGEGELTLVELVRALEGFQWGDHNRYDGGKSVEFIKRLSTVKGLALRDPEAPYDESKTVMTPPRPYIADIDSIPFPARHLVPFRQYKLLGKTTAIGTIITSRGCPYACGYCSSSRIGGIRFRARTPNSIIEELKILHDDYGVENVEFLDDIFTLNQKRAFEFTDMLKQSGIRIKWIASSRVNTISRELLRAMANVGLDTMYFGVESGSQRVLDLMGKGLKLHQAEAAFTAARNEGVKTLGSFILGYPGETMDEMSQTIRFSMKLNPDYAQFSVLTPYPGTPIYDQLKKQGLLLTEDWDKYTVLEPLVKYEAFGYTVNNVRKMLKKAYFTFYFRPSYLYRHMYMIPVALKTFWNSQVQPWLKSLFPFTKREQTDLEYDAA